MGYSLAAKFASEAIGMCLTIFMGESIIANELLPNTKGHAMGYLAVAIGFGFAFGCNIAWFGFISAHLNPGMFFFLACLGKLEFGWAEFAVGSLGDFVGAFAGAVLVYLYFAPHFWTVPLPRDTDPVSVLIHGAPDALSGDAGRIASAFGMESEKKSGKTVVSEMRDLAARVRGGGLGRLEGHSETSLTPTSVEEKGNVVGVTETSSGRGNLPRTQRRAEHADREKQRLLAKMEVRRRARATKTDASFYFSRPLQLGGAHGGDLVRPLLDTKDDEESKSAHSIQVATMLHRRDPKLAGGTDSEEMDDPSRHSVQVAAMLHERDPEVGGASGGGSAKSEGALPVVGGRTTENVTERSEPDVINSAPKGIVSFAGSGNVDQEWASRRKVRDEAFEAAIAADAHAKLSIFATRPAKYNRVANFLQEMTASIVLFFGAEMFSIRRHFDAKAAADGPYMQSAFVSLFIMVLILGLGGVTSLACNPARDFGPRLAHALLPIPGKGESEWHYGWVPFLAPFAGGGLGALLLYGVEALYRSGSDEL